jgi:tetratricopeptide (TPR) repeat protein
VGQSNNAAISSRSGISSRTVGGNSVNIGNQTVNLANNNYSASFNNHSFYHGYWNGNGWGGGGFGRFGGFGPFGYGGFGYGGFGPFGYGGFGLGYGGFGFGRGYFGYPLGWGLGAWGLGSLLYGSGYLGYNNPYYGGGGGGGSFGGYSYSQPIPVNYASTSVAATTDSTTQNPADAMLNDAIAAFKQGDYDTALNIVNRAITQYPSDSVLHEFRALVLFAKGNYREAAATLHSVLAVGPGWDWTTLSTLYPNIAIYTDQLRALENHIRNHPQDGAARFVLAYHYMTEGHADAAARQLEQVVQLVSNDRVAAELLRMLKPPAAGQSATGQATDQRGPAPRPPAESATAPSEQSQPAPKPIDPATLTGTWSASKPDGSKFELALNKDSTFRWKFTQGKQTNDFTGKYSVEANVLSLERKEGGALVGEVIPEGNGKFKFKAVGGPADDPGLDFQR